VQRLQVPIVFFDQVYSFDVGSLIKSVPRPEKKAAKEFEPVVTELFERIMQMADNAGATDENRALNYLAVRYPAIYAIVGSGIRTQLLSDRYRGLTVKVEWSS